LLERLMPDEPEVVGLNALLGFHHARRATRIGDDGQPRLLEHQDRSRWDSDAITRLDARLIAALRRGQVGAYQIQAAIAAVHATAPSFAETDWRQIAALYDRLVALSPSPVIELNRAAARAMAYGEQAGLDALAPLADDLENYAPYHSALGELLARVGDTAGAIVAFEAAMRAGTSDGEQARLEAKIRQLKD
jgi:RNA polymerase sigma-70 factor, ECF subfamily